MTTTFIQADGTAAVQLDACDATTGWGSGSLETEGMKEGSGNLAIKVSATTSTSDKTITSVDVSNDLIYVWFQENLGKIDTYAAGGFGIRLGDGTNTATYYVGGSDNYGGGWQRYVLDPNETADLGTAPNLTAITLIGVHFKTTTMVSGPTNNCKWDDIQLAAGLRVTGGTVGTPITYDDVITDDIAGAWGVVRNVAGVMFVQGILVHGDAGSSSDVYFESKNKVVVWEARPVAATVYSISIEAQATGTTSIVFGTKIGSGDTAIGGDGNTFTAESGADVAVDFSDADFDTLDMYGTTFLGLTQTFLLAANTAHEFIGNTVNNCGQLSVGSAVIRGCNFSGYAGADGAILWNSAADVKNCRFLGNDDAIEHDTIVGVYTGTADVGASTNVLLVDAGATFVVGMVGEFVFNEADGCYAEITAFNSATSISHAALTGGTLDTWANGDAYSISAGIAYDGLLFTGNTNDINNTATGSDGLFVTKANGANPITSTNNTAIISSVTISVTVLDASDDSAIEFAHVQLYLVSDYSTVVLSAVSNASGVASAAWTGATGVAVEGWARNVDFVADDYEPENINTTITATGIAITVRLTPSS